MAATVDSSMHVTDTVHGDTDADNNVLSNDECVRAHLTQRSQCGAPGS